MDTHRKALGETHPLVADDAQQPVASVCATRGSYDEAAAALQSALGIARPALGDDHQLIAIYRSISRPCSWRATRPERPSRCCGEALRIRVLCARVVPSRRRTFLEDDWSVGGTKSLLGATLIALARYGEAEAVLLEAHRDLKATPGQDREASATLARLVALYDAWGRPDKAAAYRALLTS